MCDSCYSGDARTQKVCPETNSLHWLIHEPKSFTQLREEIEAAQNFLLALDVTFRNLCLRPFLGTMSVCKTKYDWLTYGEVHQRVLVRFFGVVHWFHCLFIT